MPTGTVSFFEGSKNLGTATLSNSGGQAVASLTLSGLSLGSHQVRFDYGGDASDIPCTRRRPPSPSTRTRRWSPAARSIATPSLGQSTTLYAVVTGVPGARRRPARSSSWTSRHSSGWWTW